MRRYEPEFDAERTGLVSVGVDVGTDERLRRLIASRERQLKGGRARLASPSALDAWTGSAGFVALDYRWRVARRLLTDILVRKEVRT